MLLDALVYLPEISNAPDGQPGWLTPVQGRTPLEDTVWNIARHGIRRIFLAAGSLGEHLTEKLASRFPELVIHDLKTDALPTALDAVRREISDAFLLIDGRVVFDCNYLELERARRANDAKAAVALTPSVQHHPVLLDNGGIPSILGEGAAGPTSMDSGVAVLHRSVLEGAAPKTVAELLGAINAEHHIQGLLQTGFRLDLRMPGAANQAYTRLPQWRNKPTVFLDRDGVLNLDHGYVYSPEQFEWVENAPEVIRHLNNGGALVIVLTNQSGIARGYYSEDEFHAFTGWISEQLAEYGAHVDATYHCPHHPEHGEAPYRCQCDCRKPKAGLFDQALADWSIDLDRSVMVGDSDRDIEAAQARGVKALKFEGGDLLAFMQDNNLV